MVKIFTAAEHALLEEAVRRAEEKTRAEIALVVARASDPYSTFALAFGIALGCLASLGLWHAPIYTDFPRLMFVELIVCCLVQIVPPLRHLSLHFAPRAFLRHRAGQRAAAEYVALTQRHPGAAPIVLIYLSLAERYVHILADRAILEKLPNKEWDSIVGNLTSSVRRQGLAASLVSSVQQVGAKLESAFPSEGQKHVVPNVIEVKD